MAFFVSPKQAFAQTQPQPVLATHTACFNPTTNKLTALSTTKTCPTGAYKVTAVEKAGGFCLLKENGVNVAKAPNMLPKNSGASLDKDGKICLDEKGAPNYGTYTLFPSSTVTPPVNTNTNTGTGTGTGSGPGGGNSGNTTQGDCEDKFHKVGPLCVPNNPFPDNSIAGGETTATSLAIRIIRVLLYFAAIVAVIMAIIGGYRVMTAGGNETQAAGGRKTLTNAIIGLAITVLAYLIVSVVTNFLTK